MAEYLPSELLFEKIAELVSKFPGIGRDRKDKLIYQLGEGLVYQFGGYRVYFKNRENMVMIPSDLKAEVMLRLGRGESCGQVAKRTGVSRATVWRLKAKSVSSEAVQTVPDLVSKSNPAPMARPSIPDAEKVMRFLEVNAESALLDITFHKKSKGRASMPTGFGKNAADLIGYRWVELHSRVFYAIRPEHFREIFCRQIDPVELCKILCSAGYLQRCPSESDRYTKRVRIPGSYSPIAFYVLARPSGSKSVAQAHSKWANAFENSLT